MRSSLNPGSIAAMMAMLLAPVAVHATDPKVFLDFVRNPRQPNSIIFQACGSTLNGFRCRPLGNPEGFRSWEFDEASDRMADQGYGVPIEHDSMRKHPVLRVICGGPENVVGLGTDVGTLAAGLGTFGFGIGAKIAAVQVCKRGIALENYQKNLNVPMEVKRQFRERARALADAASAAEEPKVNLHNNYDYDSVSRATPDYLARLETVLKQVDSEEKQRKGLRGISVTRTLDKTIQGSKSLTALNPLIKPIRSGVAAIME